MDNSSKRTEIPFGG